MTRATHVFDFGLSPLSERLLCRSILFLATGSLIRLGSAFAVVPNRLSSALFRSRLILVRTLIFVHICGV